MINTLNHNFVNHYTDTIIEYFICLNCKIIVFETNDTNNLFISNLWANSLDKKNAVLNLTCEEVIIKSIIE